MYQPRLFRAAMLTMLLAICLSSLAQRGTVVQTHESLTMFSKILNEERTVLVRLPPDYARGKERFPVVYMLDGRAPLINLMTGTIEHLVWSGLMPEMILVSIPNTMRARDMMPTAIAGQPGSGGAENFLLFLQKELFPVIEQHFRVQPFRVLTGHSLSGLFVAYTFATNASLFNAYLAASPGITPPWDSGFVKQQAERHLPAKNLINQTLFFALGNEPQFVPAFVDFQQTLIKLRLKGLDHTFLQLPGENHWSTVSVVFQQGLRKVWAAWRNASDVDRFHSLAAIEGEYKALRARYGYEFAVPEALLNKAGYRLLAANETTAAIEMFARAGELYPNSANAFESLAQAFEKAGNFKKAEEQYAKALMLAQQANNQRLAESITNRLWQVKEKLRQQHQ